MAGDTLEVRLSGIGGQGLVLAGEILALALMRIGMRAALSRSYEPTSRGGLSRSDVVAGRGGVEYPLASALDELLILDQFAAGASTDLLRPGALVLVDEGRVTDPPDGDFRLERLPLAETARGAGNPRAANIVALGAMSALGGAYPLEALAEAVRERTPERFRERNLEALASGHALAARAAGPHAVPA